MRLIVALLALLLFVISLAVQLPATWLDYGLTRLSRGAIGMTSAQGSLWNGRGRLQAILPSGQVETLENVTWRVDPGALLKAGLRFEVRREADARPVLEAFAGLAGWRIDKLELSLPASLLGVFSSTLGQLGLSGQMLLSLDGVNGRDSQVAGSGQLLWHEAGSTLTQVHPLGNYRVELQGKGAALDYRLMTLGGNLNLNGAGTWQPGSYPVFTGMAVPVPAQREALAPLLRMIGKDNGAGAYTLVLDANTGLSAR